MRYYVFKVIHPSVSHVGALRIEGNTLDDAKKELSSRLNIEEGLLVFQEVVDRVPFSNFVQMWFDASINYARDTINHYRLHTPSYSPIHGVNIGDAFATVEELLNYSIAVDSSKHNIIM